MENYILQQTADNVQHDLNIVDTLADAYSTSVTYVEGDLVLNNGELYYCKVSSTTPGTWDNTKWEKASFSTVKKWVIKRLSEITVAEFSRSKSYEKGKKACYNGYVYAAKKNISGGGDFNVSDWDRVGTFTAGKGISINDNNQIDAVGLTYTTTAPSTKNNDAGTVKIVILDSEPTTAKQEGYLYFIKNNN